MVHEPWWELHSNMGGHEECILEEVPRILQGYHIGKEILKTLILKGIKDEFLELLTLIGKGDDFQLSYDDVCELCIRHSRGISKAGKNSREVSSFFSKFTTRKRDIRAEINVLFENFKYDFISSLNSQLNVLQV